MREFHSSLGEGERPMMGTILEAKFAEEAFYVIRCVKKAGAPKRCRPSLNGSSVPLSWPDRGFLHPIGVIFLLLPLSR